MIDARTSEMQKVYAPTRLNQNVDTMDLCEMFHADSQYNPLDFDPEWEAKERAKIKTYEEVDMQTEPVFFAVENVDGGGTTDKQSRRSGNQLLEEELLYLSGDGAGTHLAPGGDFGSSEELLKKKSSMRIDDFHHRSTAGLGTAAGKWLTLEDYQQFQGLKTLKTQLLMQIEEERRGTQQLRQQLAEAQKSLHEESLKPKRTSAFGVRKLSAHNQNMP
jgi:hypothetical protein